MNFKNFVFIGICLFFISPIFGQTDIDALRFSKLQAIGSGRTMGVGGAFGALGGDFTSLSTNPAGIATYRHSEVSFTPGLGLNSTISTFEGNQVTQANPYFNMSNIGLIFSNVSKRADSKWKTGNFAIGTNRLADYHQKFYFEGESKGSITERFVDLANGNIPDNLNFFEEGLAYNTYLIDNVSGSTTEYFADADTNSYTYKSQDFSSSGYTNEFVISFGGNYMHRLYLGATIGIPIVKYKQQRIYREEDITDNIPYFNSMSFSEEFSTSGFGLNLKIGAIYRLNQMIRIGAAVHSPSRLNLSDSYSSGMTSSITFNTGADQSLFDEASDIGSFDYNLNTPWRAIGSIAFILKKKGFLTAEAEWLDYGNAAFNFKSFGSGDLAYLTEVNNTIQSKYGQALNVRLGGEYVMDKIRLRAGYALYSTPFRDGIATESGTISRISGGIGYHGQNTFIDFAIVTGGNSEEYVPYIAPNSAPSVINKSSYTSSVLTIGFKFD